MQMFVLFSRDTMQQQTFAIGGLLKLKPNSLPEDQAYFPTEKHWIALIFLLLYHSVTNSEEFGSFSLTKQTINYYATTPLTRGG